MAARLRRKVRARKRAEEREIKQIAKEPERELKQISPRTDNQKKLIHTIQTKQVVVCDGPAGTGKTYVSCAMAAKFLIEGKIKKIVITRPMVTAGEQMGFLPGEMKDKIDPFLAPIYDELENAFGTMNKVKALIASGAIQIVPIAFMRGRSIKNAFIIVDEAQNCTYTQLKLIVTRLCEDAFITINGDPSQCDLKPEFRQDFPEFVRKIKQAKCVGVVTMEKSDIVRSRAVRELLEVI